MMLQAAAAFIRRHDDFTLISHVSPDGDTLGSSLALYAGLVALGKHAQVTCQDPVPVIYRFLPNWEIVKKPEDVRRTKAVISVDCADLERTGEAAFLTEQAEDTLNIDHHGTNTAFLKLNFVEHRAAAGELVYALLAELGVAINQQIGACLYTALVTDTGNFAYSNTTPNTLIIAAKLLESGINLPELNRAIFRTVPVHKLKLLGVAISHLETFNAGKIGISILSRKDFEACGATGEDTEGIIDSIRDIDTVEIAAMLREDTDGSIRVSLRGKRAANVSKIATEFGGGGHRLAAGCTILEPLLKARDLILLSAQALLKEV